MANCAADVERAQRLRFEVFNLELGEGLAESHAIGRDVDAFDEVCDHLIVEKEGTDEVVGTYRVQTGTSAADHIGYYSEREFHFDPYETIRSQMLELGRACIHSDHRNFGLLLMLWRAIADYATTRGVRYLVGCSSLTSQDPAEGLGAFAGMRQKHLVRTELRTLPKPEFNIATIAVTGSNENDGSTNGASSRLLRAYLSIGAKICGPPALDREFGTIDFLTLLDLEALPFMVRAHFLR